jgi:hypothetical protein
MAQVVPALRSFGAAEAAKVTGPRCGQPGLGWRRPGPGHLIPATTWRWLGWSGSALLRTGPLPLQALQLPVDGTLD